MSSTPPDRTPLNPIVAVDFGTSNIRVAVYSGGETRILELVEGFTSIPSVLAILPDDDFLWGQRAIDYSSEDPEHSVFFSKSLIGLPPEDLEKVAPYKWVSSGNNTCIDFYGKPISPSEILRMLFVVVKALAESHLKHEVNRIVLSVPAVFSLKRSAMLVEAATNAGLDVRRSVLETSAIALLHASFHEPYQMAAILRVGAASFEACIAEFGSNVAQIQSVSSKSGGAGLIDKIVADWLIAQIHQSTSVDCSNDKWLRQKITRAAESAKIELSTHNVTSFDLGVLMPGQTITGDRQIILTRDMFNQLIHPVIDEWLNEIAKALHKARQGPNTIDLVYLAGAGSAITLWREQVRAYFGKIPSTDAIRPEESAVRGLALQAAIMNGQVTDIILLDILGRTLSVDCGENGSVKGSEAGDTIKAIIRDDTVIPTQRREVFSTTKDNQTSFEIEVFDGDSTNPADNTYLGTLTLEGIPPAPAGEPQIEVVVDIGADSTIAITASEAKSGEQTTLYLNMATCVDGPKW